MFGILDGVKITIGVSAGILIYHLYALAIGYPSAKREARAGYVLVAEKTAAEARATELERQRNAAAQATEEHRKRLEAAQAAEQAAKTTLENEIQSYERILSAKNRQCVLDRGDVDFLLHR